MQRKTVFKLLHTYPIAWDVFTLILCYVFTSWSENILTPSNIPGALDLLNFLFCFAIVMASLVFHLLFPHFLCCHKPAFPKPTPVGKKFSCLTLFQWKFISRWEVTIHSFWWMAPLGTAPTVYCPGAREQFGHFSQIFFSLLFLILFRNNHQNYANVWKEREEIVTCVHSAIIVEYALIHNNIKIIIPVVFSHFHCKLNF